MLLEDMDISDAESDDCDVDATDDEWVKPCCSCSKSSSCKTNKCQCRVAGNSCGKSCGCVATKCANRELVSNEEPPQLEVAEVNANGSSIQETNEDQLLATQGAELLQSALVEKQPSETNNDRVPRKPLSDIGNTLVYLHQFIYFHLLGIVKISTIS